MWPAAASILSCLGTVALPLLQTKEVQSFVKRYLELQSAKQVLALGDQHCILLCGGCTAAAALFLFWRHGNDLKFANKQQEPLASELRRAADRRFFTALGMLGAGAVVFTVVRSAVQVHRQGLELQLETQRQQHHLEMEQLRLREAVIKTERDQLRMPIEDLLAVYRQVDKLPAGTSYVLVHNDTLRQQNLYGGHTWGKLGGAIGETSNASIRPGGYGLLHSNRNSYLAGRGVWVCPEGAPSNSSLCKGLDHGAIHHLTS